MILKNILYEGKCPKCSSNDIKEFLYYSECQDCRYTEPNKDGYNKAGYKEMSEEDYTKKVERDNKIEWLIAGGVAFSFITVGVILSYIAVNRGIVSYWQIFFVIVIIIVIEWFLSCCR